MGPPFSKKFAALNFKTNCPSLLNSILPFQLFLLFLVLFNIATDQRFTILSFDGPVNPLQLFRFLNSVSFSAKEIIIVVVHSSNTLHTYCSVKVCRRFSTCSSAFLDAPALRRSSQRILSSHPLSSSLPRLFREDTSLFADEFWMSERLRDWLET